MLIACVLHFSQNFAYLVGKTGQKIVDFVFLAFICFIIAGQKYSFGHLMPSGSQTHLAKILPENTLIYSYMWQKSKLHIEVKVCLRPKRPYLGILFQHLSHILPCYLKMIILVSLRQH